MNNILYRDLRGELYGDGKTLSGDLATLAHILLQYQAAKDRNYDGSWAKRGLLGVWHGALGRTLDRVDPTLEKVAAIATKEGNVPTLVINHAMDTLADLVLYSLMTMVLFQRLFPDEASDYISTLHAFLEMEGSEGDEG